MDNELRILKSYKQTVLAGNETKEKVYKGEKLITIEGNKFSVELPTGSLLTGSLKSQGTENGKEIFHTDKECPIVISNSEVFLNLYRTHEAAFTFYLGDEPAKNKSWFGKLFGIK